MTGDDRRALAEFWRGELRWDEPMARHSTMKAGGRAEALVTANDRHELENLLAWLEGRGLAWRVIGRCSNLIVRDEGFNGVLLLLGQGFRGMVIETADTERLTARAGAACSLIALARHCADQGAAGLEFASGIPGSVGGAVAMNAGAWGVEIADLLDHVHVVDPRSGSRRIARQDLDFSYRRCRGVGGNGLVVLDAVFSLHRADADVVREKCRELKEKRNASQPHGLPSAGSIFRNPANDYAGRLIEAAGCKGLRRGGAMVSERHVNVIVNTGAATATDVIGLIEEVKARVEELSGIRLELEVELI